VAYGSAAEESQVLGARAQSLSRYRHLLGQRDGKLATLRDTIGPAGDRWKRAEDQLYHAAADTRAIYAKLGRLTDGNGLAVGWFIGAAIILALLEAPINKFMLDNILRGSNFDSYVISVFVTFVMLALAHYAGHHLRQFRSEYEERIYLSKIVVSMVILIILLGCISVLTIGRAFYSTAALVAVGKDIFSEIGRQVITVGLWQTLKAALSDNSALFLACLNTAGLAIAFLAAFTRYDSDKNYESAIDAERRANKALAKLETKYSQAVSRVAKNFEPKLSGVAAAYGAQTARLVTLKANRGAQITAEDQYDIAQEDVLLSQARSELGQKAQQRAADRPAPRSIEEAQPVLPLMARERR